MFKSPDRPSFEQPTAERPERGKNVRILLKLIRHGERTPGGELTDYGREVTRERAREAELPPEIKRAKAVGSPVKPKGSPLPPRSLETADIYVQELTPSREGELPRVERYATRPRNLLNFEPIRTTFPFDFNTHYNAILPPNFAELSDAEKAEAAHRAQTACVDRLLATPGAEVFIRDAASRVAVFVDRYLRMPARLKDGSQVLYVAGTHGAAIMEPFLHEVLIRKTSDGRIIHGFQSSTEIGGAIRPSEAFTIDIATDAAGEEILKVHFDDPERLPGEELTLDLEKIRELKDEYLRNYRAPEETTEV